MKKIILITTTIILIIISIFLITFHNKEIEVNAPKFELSKEKYASSEYKEITSDSCFLYTNHIVLLRQVLMQY